MPYIQARLSIKLDECQKDDLQRKLTEVTSSALSKPKTYIMTEIADGKSLYMSEKKVEKGAYISIKMFGAATKQACNTLTQDICNILSNDYEMDGQNVYITFQPVDLWGWNGFMF